MPEREPQPQDPAERLLSEAKHLQEHVQSRRARGANEKKTDRQIRDRVEQLTAEYTHKNVFVEAPLQLTPEEDNVAVGFGEASGKIIGFIWGEYPVLGADFQQEGTEEGLLLMLGVGGVNNLPASQGSYIDLPEPVSDVFHREGLRPLYVPLTEAVRIQGLENPATDFSTLEDLYEQPEKQLTYDYMEYAESIGHLVSGLTGKSNIDKPRWDAIYKKLEAMNDNCPFLGQEVEVESSYLRAPHPDKPSLVILDGKLTGVLRKFVCWDEGDYQGVTTQAVVYQPDMARQVQNGQIAPQEADRSPGTVYVSLDKPHKLSALGESPADGE